MAADSLKVVSAVRSAAAISHFREMNAKQRTTAFIWILLLCCIPGGTSRGDQICGYPEAGTVEIIRGNEMIGQFGVALAESVENQRRGLMHCPRLAPDTGLLFVYPDARRRVFWMKNTVIELAIIFISADGRIAAIERGRPGSLEHIRSSTDIRSVLEINYPESRRLSAGDRVRLRLNGDRSKR
jgi:uncharacterized membrane protein (UPF0127 family)